jgi:poly(glycerol-phosphate) alpha-glucosyltransferase
MYTSVVTNNWFKTGKPYITTIHGMLEPWALKNAGWKKKIVTILYEGKCLKNATCIHAHTYKEYQDIRKFGLKNPVCIIPNGVDIPEGKTVQGKPAWFSKAGGRKVMLYLGRLHPKKGLENLIEAWAKTPEDNKDWCLVVAGWGEKEYMTLLENKTRELQQEQNIIFAGPQFDQDKEKTLSSSDAFILPSLSEGLPMAILEAWAYHLPALYTNACNIPEGYEHQAAIKIEASSAGLAKDLKAFFSMPEEQLKSLGGNGYNLVLKKFTWNKVAEQMAVVYKWLVNGGPKPEMVYLD